MEYASEIEEKLARSLTADTTGLIPYLPYLLQDLWELGSAPGEIAGLISEHIPVSGSTRILDLACGKGAVSVHLAVTFGCHIKGVDLTPEFIAYARMKAEEFSVDSLCDFRIGDISQSIIIERDYDVVILGAVGDVLGDSLETILKLKEAVKPGGYIVIDGAYKDHGSDQKYPSRNVCLDIFRSAGVRLAAEKEADKDDLMASNRFNQEHITRRANELKALHPDKLDMFEGYIRSQQAECDELEGEITGVTWLLQVV